MDFIVPEEPALLNVKNKQSATNRAVHSEVIIVLLQINTFTTSFKAAPRVFFSQKLQSTNV